MISFRDLTNAFRAAGLTPDRPVIVHTALSSFGDEIRGGPETVIGSLLTSTAGIMAPTFTYKTMITPETGPENNAMRYGSGKDANRLAEFFTPDMRADSLMGLLPEVLRNRSEAIRSSHPLLSFSGIGVPEALNQQTLTNPFGPIQELAEQDGLVLLIGVDQRSNTSIHAAEALAGRKQFVRWALTCEGIRECPGFPGCSEGFNQAVPHFQGFARYARIAEATIQTLPILRIFETVIELLHNDPEQLLCSRADCERCSAVRAEVNRQAE
jgi:aminoglycoside 3-N-acetyltransferase